MRRVGRWCEWCNLFVVFILLVGVLVFQSQLLMSKSCDKLLTLLHYTCHQKISRDKVGQFWSNFGSNFCKTWQNLIKTHIFVLESWTRWDIFEVWRIIFKGKYLKIFALHIKFAFRLCFSYEVCTVFIFILVRLVLLAYLWLLSLNTFCSCNIRLSLLN